MTPPTGSRVVVRYRLPVGSSHPVTDVIGRLVADDPVVTVQRDSGELVRVDRADVLALKAIPARPVAASAVREVEHAAALGWPGLVQRWHEGWLLRAGGGLTDRAGSAVPLAGPLGDEAPATTDPASLAAITAFYAEHGLPAQLLVPDRLGRPPAGWALHGETVVLTGPAGGQGANLLVTPAPDPAWVGCWARAAEDPALAARLLSAVVDGELGFGRITEAGEVLAITRAAVTTTPSGTRWVGLTAVEVAPGARGRGLGRRVCEAMLGWAAAHGAERSYVQVAADNAAALALYATLGFTEHHRYRYARER